MAYGRASSLLRNFLRANTDYERESGDNAAKDATVGSAVEARSTLQSTVANSSLLRSSERHFYLWMAGVFVLIAFGGFTPTYWARVAGGTFHGPPILHIHGALLFSWLLTVPVSATQTWMSIARFLAGLAG
jgi:hypothetical protein